MHSSLLLLAFIAAKGISADCVGNSCNTCQSDNCLRELQDARFSAKASLFCATYTTTNNPNPTAIPDYLENCDGSPSAVSSACSCLMPPSSTTQTSSSSSTSVLTTTTPSITTVPTTTSISSTSSNTVSTSSSTVSTSSSTVSTSSSTVSTSSSTVSTSSTITSNPTPLDCHPDNCLRELQDSRFSSMASAFCYTYTTTYNADPSAIPTYLENCDQSPPAVSSACSCLIPPNTSSTSSSATPTPTPCALPSFTTSECGTTEVAAGSLQGHFSIECGQTYDVSLAASVSSALSSDDCLNICDSQPGCEAVTFDTTGCKNNCYLFSSLTGLTTSQSATSDSAALACAALTGPDPTTCGSTLTGGTDSRPYQVQCGLAYTGSSSLSPVTSSSYNDCFNACDANPQCGAFTFDSSVCTNNCQLVAYYDDMSMASSSTANSGFTPGNAREFSCGSAICGSAVYGGGYIGDGYLVECRSSYSFTQASDISGSPFTATSFKDCLQQCDNNYNCNYMSFDSSKFENNCAMFERAGVSSDVLTANPNIDSAKALVGQTGGTTGDFSPDVASCPTYSSTSGTCSAGTLTPYHHSTYTYSSACKTRYTAGTKSVTSTLTVNTYLQCLDACDKNNHCSYMTFTNAAVSTVDNCQFISGSATKTKNTPNYDSAVY